MGFKNAVRIATCNDEHKQQAVNELYSRSLLFNRSDNSLGIVLENDNNKEYVSLSANPDNKNIEKIEGKLSLKNDIIVKSVTSISSDVSWISQKLLFETEENHTICILFKADKYTKINKILTGNILQTGETVSSNYRIFLATTNEKYSTGITSNKSYFDGNTTLETSAVIVIVLFQGEHYFAIKFDNTPSKVYFVGWDNIPEDFKCNKNYSDSDLEIVDDTEFFKELIFIFLSQFSILKNISFGIYKYFSWYNFSGLNFSDRMWIFLNTGTIQRELKFKNGYLFVTKGLAGKLSVKKPDSKISFEFINNNTDMELTISQITNELTVGETVQVAKPFSNNGVIVTFQIKNLPVGEYFFSQKSDMVYYSVTILE